MKILFLTIIGLILTVKMTAAQTNQPKTLLEFAGFESNPAKLSDSVLVMIDAQKEFTEGKLKLSGIDAATKEARKILDRARLLGTSIIHVRHQNKPGAALFDPASKFVEGIDLLKPEKGEIIVNKGMANAFAGSTLDAEIQKSGKKNLIVVGYMTYMAVDATVRAALERGFQTTVIGDACATRDLADGYGTVISAAQIQTATLAALRDRFAAVIKSETELLD